MTTPALAAARHRAHTGIAAVLTGHTFGDDADATAADIVARLEADGWHHASSHAAPPPPPETGDPPSEQYRQARAALGTRTEEDA